MKSWLKTMKLVAAATLAAVLVGLVAGLVEVTHIKEARAGIGTSFNGVSGYLTQLAAQSDCTAAANGTASPSKVVLYDAGGSNTGGLGFSVVGTWTATRTNAVSVDGVNWQVDLGVSTTNGLAVSSSTGVTTNEIHSRGGWRYFCIYFSAYTSGTGIVTIEPYPSAPVPMIFAGYGAGTRPLSNAGAVNVSVANSGILSLMVTPVGAITLNSFPAVNTQATASVAAGAAGVRHIASQCDGSISAVAAQTDITLNLRDGATGAGTVLWAQRISCTIGTPCVLSSGPIQAFGTAATAMTCEWSGIPVTNNFETANLHYHDAS